MRVTYLPVLAVLRELYLQPRDMRRFREYIQTMTGGTDDVVLPIGLANPMAREHALSRVDELIALDADASGAAAARDAEVRLRDVPGPEIKASIVLVDDVGGGWTNRYTTEAMARFPSRGALKRPFATALVWTSESPSAVFARAQPWLAGAALQRARERIHDLGDDPPYPRAFAALYGDAAAEQLGYEPLGLSPRAGFGVALADELDRKRDAIEVLLGKRVDDAPHQAVPRRPTRSR